MAASQTTRLAIYTWTAGTDTFTRDQMTTSHTNIESRVAGYNQAGSRPAASAAYTGFVHYSSTDSSAGTLSYCNGTAWFNIGALGSTTPNAIDGNASAGSSQDGSRSDHKHAIADNAITNAMIANNAVQADQIQQDAVTTVKILNSNVTHEKIENSAANSVLGRSANSGGVVADISTSTNGEVLRLSGSTLGFGKVATAGLATDAVTNAILDSTDGSEAVSTDTIQDGAVTALKLASDAVTTIKILNDNVTHEKIEESVKLSVLGVTGNAAGHVADIQADADDKVLRRYNDTLGFGAVQTGGIANTAITDAKLADDAVVTRTLATDAVTNDALDLNAISVYGKEGSAGAGHRIFKSENAPAGGAGSYAEGDIWLEYTA